MIGTLASLWSKISSQFQGSKKSPSKLWTLICPSTKKLNMDICSSSSSSGFYFSVGDDTILFMFDIYYVFILIVYKCFAFFLFSTSSFPYIFFLVVPCLDFFLHLKEDRRHQNFGHYSPALRNLKSTLLFSIFFPIWWIFH